MSKCPDWLWDHLTERRKRRKKTVSKPTGTLPVRGGDSCVGPAAFETNAKARR